MNKIEDQVIQLVATFTGVGKERINHDTTLFGDLGVDGDDGIEFLTTFAETFDVDMKDCKINQYFGPELFIFPLAIFTWPFNLFRKDTSEEKAGLRKIRIADLMSAAQKKKWTIGA